MAKFKAKINDNGVEMEVVRADTTADIERRMILAERALYKLQKRSARRAD